MKVLAAAFTTAVMVFAIATLVSELMPSRGVEPALLAETDHSTRTASTASIRRKPRSSDRTASAVSARRATDQPSQRGSNVAQEPVEVAQRRLAAVRQREDILKAQQQSLQLIYEEIRSEQSTVNNLRKQVSEELTALTQGFQDLEEPNVMIAREAAPIPQNAARTDNSRRATPTTTRKPFTVENQQAVRDTAILIRRLIAQNSFRAATSLLANMRERDAAKVLTSLVKTDPEIASRLTATLEAARESANSRR